MLTDSMKWIIENYSVGSVATINEDGTPAVSPKATFVVIDDACIAFGDIRSPGTVGNLRARPAVEVTFIDVLTRRAVRVKGCGEVVAKSDPAARHLLSAFEKKWAPYIDAMQHFVSIEVGHAELILSPAYDMGYTAAELRQVNLGNLQNLD